MAPFMVEPTRSGGIRRIGASTAAGMARLSATAEQRSPCWLGS
jgi:hypothetical protein